MAYSTNLFQHDPDKQLFIGYAKDLSFKIDNIPTILKIRSEKTGNVARFIFCSVLDNVGCWTYRISSADFKHYPGLLSYQIYIKNDL